MIFSSLPCTQNAGLVITSMQLLHTLTCLYNLLHVVAPTAVIPQFHWDLNLWIPLFSLPFMHTSQCTRFLSTTWTPQPITVVTCLHRPQTLWPLSSLYSSGKLQPCSFNCQSTCSRLMQQSKWRENRPSQLVSL